MPDFIAAISFADVLGVVLIFGCILMPQLKSIRLILLAELTINAGFCLYYWLLDGRSAALLSIFATAHAVVNVFYQQRGKRPTWWVFGLFSAIYIACGILTWTGPVDLLSTTATLFFALSLQQTTPTGYRLCTVGKCTSWVIYGLILGAWSSLLANLFTLLSALAALVRNRTGAKAS